MVSLPAVGASLPGAVNGVNDPSSVSADSTNRNGTNRLCPLLPNGGRFPPMAAGWLVRAGQLSQRDSCSVATPS